MANKETENGLLRMMHGMLGLRAQPETHEASAPGAGRAESLAPEADALKALSARTAHELVRLKKEKALSGEIDDYIADEGFLSLLTEMPAATALRLYEAEKRLQDSQEALKAAREEGARDLMEKLVAQKSLPAPLRQAALAAPETDYMSMTSEQFRAAKQALNRAARENRK